MGNVFKLEKESVKFWAYDEDKKEVVNVFLLEKDIERSYRGRVGCMCGCRGSYSNDKKLGMQRVRKIIELCNEFKLLPVIRTLKDGRKVLHLPTEIEMRKGVRYVVYLSP